MMQSKNASLSTITVNGDGFGVCWYGDDESPGQYRDIMPAWGDSNLDSLCRVVRSPVFLAHVRASTVGETSRVNCHPFVNGRWSFMHNGQVPHFARIRRYLENQLDDKLFELRQGTTDSELIFLLMLQFGLDIDPVSAVQSVLGLLYTNLHASEKAMRLTLVFSNGISLFAVRHSSDDNSPTLYTSKQLDSNGIAFASEPLDGKTDNWTLVPENSFTTLKNGRADITTL